MLNKAKCFFVAIVLEKIIPTLIFGLLFVVRYIKFYEIKGIRLTNGWGAPSHHKLAFLISIIMFLAGVWLKWGNRLIHLILQITPIVVMLNCERLYFDFCDYRLEHVVIGCRLYLVLSVILLFYCILITLISKKPMRENRI